MDLIAVLIPCYNEAPTIHKVVTDFRQVLPEATIYVYDNNSTDGTGEIAREAGAVVRREPMQGKGNVIRRMFREIDAKCYIMVDGDDTYPAEDARIMADMVLNEQADMVVGDRLSSTYFSENKRPFHNFGNSLVRSTINRLFHSNIMDIMTGYRAFSFLFVKTYPVLSQGFEIETDMTIHAIYRHMNVNNHVITYRDRPEGSISKLNTGRDGIKVLSTVVSLYRMYRPMAFFGLLALILFLISMLFLSPVLAEFVHTGLVPRFPTLITCLFVIVAAIMMLTIGIILTTLQEKDRRDFEFELNTVYSRFLKKCRETN